MWQVSWQSRGEKLRLWASGRTSAVEQHAYRGQCSGARPRGGQEEDKAQPQSPATEFRARPGLCGWALSSSCPPLGRAPELCQLCGCALWLGLVLLLAAVLNTVNSVAGLCGWASSSSCPPLGCVPGPCQPSCPLLDRAPELSQLCGWALWLGLFLLLSSS